MHELSPHWPPVPVGDDESVTAKLAFFEYTRARILHKSRDPRIREFFQAAEPQHQRTFLVEQYLTDPPPEEIVEAITLPSEGLTPYHQNETASEICNFRFQALVCLYVPQHPKIDEACGSLEAGGTYTVSEKTTRKILRMIPPKLRVAVAHILCMNHIQGDNDLCDLYERETGIDVRPQSQNAEKNAVEQGEDEHGEELVTIGAWDEDEDETDIQSRFEYARLREFFETLMLRNI